MDHSTKMFFLIKNNHIWFPLAPHPPMPAHSEGSPLALHHSKQHLLFGTGGWEIPVVMIDYTTGYTTMLVPTRWKNF